ncbi:DNA topoisomerase 4 subunit A [Kurthia zopfii]|uniref:DNA topoisomerase 4 subunit A n=1 Tax=Kurthia zopfii TaxID=1650 RepID=A0A8B4QAJ3_9BACL|nr:DNA topoisomerase IV subunit A [Kurthia zopfii]PWI22991.1 DNA topoisomerase IV subunit A [Kurthia zopfii]TDR40904.1 topoisomerase-4 subunit A [Kurthia zopfii]GEK31714.1 DNA topoisomerase 4 subunit A [Kurthia zopfii]STX09736.1 DNA topoisomerase 4 subunit A [Kurthia zopfii]
MTEHEKFQDLPLEEVIGDRFGRYSKYIIQDRALPDARDGLKPVQRRILYAMYMDNNTNEKPFRKSAKTVGNVIANYHPHGDSSVYEAMVRLSQDWKSRHMLVEMHGNNGSLDGDSPAAMRYTEARLSSISAEMLRDIQKETVDFIPNFDDQDMEPTVLPARFPNLLVNGSTGISAGYATDIPPHALHEVIDAVLMRMKNAHATVDELMKVISGPDFPTGGIIQGVAGIKKAYETGKGKIVVRAKTRIESLKGSKEQIIVDEIPYEVNKANLVKKMDELRVDKRLEGIAEVRDESDRQGLRIVVEMRRDVPAEPILQYLFKNTDLQVTYNFNMIAIYNRRPVMMTLPLMLDAYIDHQKEIITKRSQYDLKKAHARLHIVEGLMKALSILDEVIATIRGSKDKKDAKSNLQTKFDFTEIQSEAIVSLQLYRLTNTDITELREEKAQLEATVAELQGILNDEQTLIAVLKKELLDIRKRFKQDRRSLIQEQISEIKLNMEVLIPSEDVIVSVTKDGYVKRTSLRSHKSSNGAGFAMKESDSILLKEQLNTQNHLLLFTNKGQYIFQPIHELPDIRWKDLGQHISSIVSLDDDEQIINAIGVQDFSIDAFVVTVTKYGQIKRSALKEYFVTRYNKPYKAVNVKKDDELLFAEIITETQDVILSTYLSFALRFPISEVPVTSVRTAGIKACNLKDDDYIVATNIVDADDKGDLLIITQRGSVKKMAIKEFEYTGRPKRGLQTLRELKTNPHRIYDVLKVKRGDQVEIETEKDVVEIIEVDKYRHAERHSNGSLAINTETDGEIRRIFKICPEQ